MQPLTKLYSYALIHALHREGHDYIEVFYPFVLRALPQDFSYSKIKDIRDMINLRFGFDIPRYALETIIKRAIKDEYIEYNNKKHEYVLTKKGLEFIQSIDDIEEKQKRRLNKFLLDMTEFINRNSPSSTPKYQKDRVEEGFFRFIESNINLLIGFLSSHISPFPEEKEKSKEQRKLDIEIYKYIKHIYENNDDMFEIFQEIILGSIISIALFYDHTDQNIKEKFTPLTIYLDSNFLFSLFELHTKERNKATKELFDMIKKYSQFKIKVFDFTLAEMVRVVKGYPTAISKYSSKIRVDSLYDILRKKGWKEPQVNYFIATLEDSVKELGIEIEHTDIDLNRYSPDCVDNPSEIRLKLAKYKPQSMYNSDTAFFESQNHDLASICLIQKKRGKSPRKIENAEYIFLTSDLKLSKFNLETFGHKISGTIPEVIPDRLLATILWLKDPTLNPNLPVHVIIASYSNTLLVARGIWEKFYQIVLRLKESGKISQDDIATLFYHDYIETVLLEFSEEEIDEINEEFVLKSIEEATKKMEKDIEKRKEQEIEKKYTTLIKQKEPELIEEGKRIQKEQILKRVEKISNEKANRYSIIVCTGSAIALSALLIYLLGIPGAIAGLILGGGGTVLEILKGYPKIKPFIKEWIKNKQLKELGLED
ncbi:hypothetical protein E3E23_06555 [Thermococcus sp. CX2]|uniref:hypothetical protein n=1 Tax=Thermococcus sp. CX2 TaxID=163006 RepID=UPI00143A00A1|nr:hypothetical protein [Thermococcus sp. CX2]NJE85484.1 hypothetical protein [Thermococcus sp. CX2]